MVETNAEVLARIQGLARSRTQDDLADRLGGIARPSIRRCVRGPDPAVAESMRQNFPLAAAFKKMMEDNPNAPFDQTKMLCEVELETDSKPDEQSQIYDEQKLDEQSQRSRARRADPEEQKPEEQSLLPAETDELSQIYDYGLGDSLEDK